MKQLKKSFLLLLLLVASVLFIAACGGSDDDQAEDPDAEDNDNTEETIKEGGDLVIANLSDVVSLDPHGNNDTPSSNVRSNIYETLVTHDQDMELQPGLAHDWEMTGDLTWEFYLEEGVKFHDGADFTADVVKANIERIQDDAIASPRAFLYDMVTEINVIDDYTVEFVTEYPFAPLPAHLAHDAGGMISPNLIDADYTAMEEDEAEPGSVINEGPVGTGPFVFQSWTPGEEVVLQKNADYHGDPAHLDSVTFKVVPEDATRIAELETGASHIADPLSPSDVSRVEAADGMFVNIQPSVSLSYIGFNVQKEPFDDVRVRQAISMAIDKDGIINGIYDGYGVPAIGPLAPTVFGYDDSVSGLEYDVEKAKELLAEAGYADGFSTTIWTNDNRERMDAAIYVQAELEKIGVDVEIEVLEWGAYLENTAAGEHDMFVLGWSTVTGDADYGMFALFHSSMFGEPGNRSFLANDKLDDLLTQARQTSDSDERLDLYRQAQEVLVDEAPMLYLHHQEYLLAIRDEVKGFWQHPTQILMLKDVWLDQ
ncbi:glutathione ABC transporter substrate-binding protein [Amphibacillus sediminis]|uniref:glutathione ABC transporter substrate-binding protein n=1 Tax=Amphibacillus sediminis TaxID=360185 RepID=UPI000837A6C1|nr:glutathione ABC transporter substrate-binding protein [Amphibacillus sediminis]